MVEETSGKVTDGEKGGARGEKERHRCTYFYVIAVEAMHCCRETKANVAEKLRRKGEARGTGRGAGMGVGRRKRAEEGRGGFPLGPGTGGGTLHARDKAE